MKAHRIFRACANPRNLYVVPAGTWPEPCPRCQELVFKIRRRKRTTFPVDCYAPGMVRPSRSGDFTQLDAFGGSPQHGLGVSHALVCTGG